MKVKTSITLSVEVIGLIDRHHAEFRSRSEFLEHAAKAFLVHLAKVEADQRDLKIINQHAAELNAEAADVLNYQVAL